MNEEFFMRKPKARGIRREPVMADETQIMRSKAAGGGSELLNQKVKNKFGIPFSFLLDAQWDEIVQITGLHIAARFEINIALRRYWDDRIKLKVDPETIERVVDARDALEKAIDELVPLLDEEELYKGRIIHFEQSAAEQNLRLERCVETMARTEGLLSRVQARLEKSRKPGNEGYGRLYELIHHLDNILHHFLGVNITRSSNRIPSPMASGTSLDFVIAVLQIADLNVTRSTIDTILRDYIKNRAKHGNGFQNT